VEIVERNGHFWWGWKIPGFPCEIAHTLSTFDRPQQQNKNVSRGQGKMLGKDCLRADQDLNIPCYVAIDT
jgi:hypothetical protein